MKSYKVTRIYLVTAESKAQALTLVNSAGATEYLSVEYAKETDAQEERSAWSNAVKSQVFGAKK